MAIFVGHMLPARQLTHADDAVVSAYSPSLHATHTADPRVLYSPLAQSTGVPDKLKHFCPEAKINRQNVPVQIVLLLLVHKCVMNRCVMNRCENYVLRTTMFLDKLPFCLETAVPVSCLPRVIFRHVRFQLENIHIYEECYRSVQCDPA